MTMTLLEFFSAHIDTLFAGCLFFLFIIAVVFTIAIVIGPKIAGGNDE